MKRSRPPLVLALVTIVACALAGAAAGRILTAGIPSWGTTYAGAGSQPINPYTVSNIAYNLDANYPQYLDSVTFSLSPTTANHVEIELNGHWYTCSGGASVTCATTSPQAQAVNAANTSLTVVATQ